MNEVKVFDNLKVKEENGQVLFDAETAAIGLGISEVAKSGNTVVKWTRINKYLGIDTSVDNGIKRGDFITEPQFYKLAIKANNETAEKFQDWVTSEVLPAIRKHGSYMTNEKAEALINRPNDT
ncbi:BRO family protein, partial [uncultured Leuconostoc sp.]|uniref:BRO-N domain-containing protein n=1 Tax=uncultured Leuconostoc sp. TaxID=173262 RepID=UPI002592381D